MNELHTKSDYRTCRVCRFRWPIEEMVEVEQILDRQQYVCKLCFFQSDIRKPT